jgi:hypothetical protein
MPSIGRPKKELSLFSLARPQSLSLVSAEAHARAKLIGPASSGQEVGQSQGENAPARRERKEQGDKGVGK